MPMFQIASVSDSLDADILHAINHKTKPPGSLGVLESTAFQLCRIQQSCKPQLTAPRCFVFAGDHGLAAQGVSAFPQEVTAQMVLNFLAGGAAINVFCQQHRIQLDVVNTGVAQALPQHPGLIDCSVAPGTKDSSQGPAMTAEQVQQCLANGAELIRQASDSTLFLFGEMGIANTSAAALIMHLLTGLPLAQCVGAGTGLNDTGLSHKYQVLQQVATIHQQAADQPLEVLRCVGGFEIATLCGAMLAAAEAGKTILVDGFITSAALLVAYRLQPAILDYCIFSHVSGEQGHAAMLDYFSARPLLNLGMRLGEGSAAAIAYPLVASAAAFMNDMASFDEAGVSTADA